MSVFNYKMLSKEIQIHNLLKKMFSSKPKNMLKTESKKSRSAGFFFVSVTKRKKIHR